MTGTAAPTKRRDRFRQLHKFFPLRTAANQTGLSSTSLSAPIPSTLASSSAAQPSLKSDLGTRPASPAHEVLCPAQPCSKAPVALGRELLDRALQLLPQQERATIKKNILPTTDDINSALQKAFNATQEKQNLCQNKRWTFTFGEHTVRLAQEADKILLWLDRFKSVGDIAVNADSIHAGLPWAGIRLLLEVWRFVTSWFQNTK